MNELPVWDQEDALKRMGGKVDRLVMLLKLYLQESDKYFHLLVTAFQTQQITEIAHTAHTMAGVVGNLSAKQLHYTCKQLESAALESNIIVVDQLWPVFKQQFDELNHVISNSLDNIAVDKANTVEADSTALKRNINQLAQALLRNDFLTPGEVKALFPYLKTTVADSVSQALLSQIDDMNYPAALETLRIIAQQVGVTIDC